MAEYQTSWRNLGTKNAQWLGDSRMSYGAGRNVDRSSQRFPRQWGRRRVHIDRLDRRIVVTPKDRRHCAEQKTLVARSLQKLRAAITRAKAAAKAKRAGSSLVMVERTETMEGKVKAAATAAGQGDGLNAWKADVCSQASQRGEEGGSEGYGGSRNGY